MNTYIIQHSTNPNDPNGSERRHSILLRNKELLEHQASLHPQDDLAYIIIDMLREGKDFPLDTSLKQFITTSEQNDVIPTQLMAIPRWSAYKRMRQLQKNLHQIDPEGYPKESPVVEKLKEPPPQNHFLVLVISGGKQLATFPIPENNHQ